MQFLPPVVGLLILSVTLFAVWRLQSLGKLDKNHVIGIRTRNTLHSDRTWEVAHQAAAPYLLCAAILGASFAVALATVSGITEREVASNIVALAGLIITGSVVGAGGLVADRAAKGLIQER